jgi:hypothetical protein
VAPNAPLELATPMRVLVELVTFGIGVAAYLYAAGRPRLVWICAGLVVNYASPQAFQAAIGQPQFRQAAAAIRHRAHSSL